MFGRAVTTHLMRATVLAHAAVPWCCPVWVSPLASAEIVIYVDDDAPPGGSGTSWDSAYRFLQDALSDAAGRRVPQIEIRVAQGLYRPDRGEQHPGGTGDRDVAFELLNDVALRGGFAGPGTPDPDARDITLYQTSLSGDLAGDDEPGFVNNGENSHTIVYAGSAIDTSAILDGFVITAANADGSGALMTPATSGGGLFNNAGSPIITDCAFRRNAAGHGHTTDGGGAAVFSWGGAPTFIGVDFIGNATAKWGGGANFIESSPYFANCRFIGNTAWKSGGIAQSYTSTTLINCLFTGNTAELWAGAISSHRSAPTIINCTIAGNTAPDTGGLRIKQDPEEGGTVIVNSVLWGNQDSSGDLEHAQISLLWADPACVSTDYCCIQDWHDLIEGVGNIDAAPRFIDPDGADGLHGTMDDDLHLLPGSPCIDSGDNTAVPVDITTDLDGTDRCIDDPYTEDTGVGQPPIVDMGCYEFTATVAGQDGPRLWGSPAGGVFSDPVNWLPDPPSPADAAVFAQDGEYTVSFTDAAVTHQLVVADGDVTFDLAGSTYALADLSEESVLVGEYADEPVTLRLVSGTLSSAGGRIGGRLGADGTMVVDGAGSLWTAQNEVAVGPHGSGELTVTNGGAVTADGGVKVAPGSQISGNSLIQGDVMNLGMANPGFTLDDSPFTARLTIDGDYAQTSGLGSGQAGLGSLAVQINGDAPGDEYDVLEITGEATLAGSLMVFIDPEFIPALKVDDEFVILTGETVNEHFDVAWLPGLGEEKRLTVDYQDGKTGGRGGSVTIIVQLLEQLLKFDDTPPVVLNGTPSDIAIGDFDGKNGIDLAISFTGSLSSEDGSVLVMLNAGVDPDGNWLGFGSITQWPVGPAPSSLTVGLLNDDGFPDIAVADSGAQSISILLNKGNGDGAFHPVQTVPISLEPLAIAAAKLDDDDHVDLAVTGHDPDPEDPNRYYVLLLRNTGGGTFEEVASAETGLLPIEIDPDDIDKDYDVDLVAANQGDGTVSVIFNESGTFKSVATVQVGHQPSDLITVDLDQDENGYKEIVVLNREDGTASILVYDGEGGFTAAATLPVGAEPRSITAIDFDLDGDLDLALVADSEVEPTKPVVQVLRNDLAGPGDMVITDAEELDAGEGLAFVLNGDLDSDLADDLIAVSVSVGGWSAAPNPPDETPLGAVMVLLNAVEACPGDVDGDDWVGVPDLIAVLASWGQSEVPEDVNRDGIVDVLDLLALLATWGPCP